jgi:acetyltransferase-like isoleucine patch superfamily enzyme
MYLEKISGSWYPHDFAPGLNFKHGLNCIIESDVQIGSNVTLGHRVLLKSGTRILDNVVLADDCCTTGLCIIGNNAAIRTGSTISKGVIVNDWVFIGAGVMTSHTKNVYHGRPNMKPCQHVTQLGYGCIIGSRANLKAGVSVATGSIVAYGSNVMSDLTYAFSIYMGNPCARRTRLVPPYEQWKIDVPDDYVPYMFTREQLEQYLPYAL